MLLKTKCLKIQEEKKKVMQFLYFKYYFWLNFFLLPRKLSVWNTVFLLEIDFLLLCDCDKLLCEKETGHLQNFFSHEKLSLVLTTWKIKRQVTSCEEVIISENTKMCADMCVLLYAHMCLCTLYGVFLNGRITTSERFYIKVGLGTIN